MDQTKIGDSGKQWFSCTRVFDGIFWLGIGVARWAIGFNLGPYLVIFGWHNKPNPKAD